MMYLRVLGDRLLHLHFEAPVIDAAPSATMGLSIGVAVENEACRRAWRVGEIVRLMSVGDIVVGGWPGGLCLLSGKDDVEKLTCLID